MLGSKSLVLIAALAAFTPLAGAQEAGPDKAWKRDFEREMAATLAGYSAAVAEKDADAFESVAPSNPYVRGYLYFKRGDHAKAQESFRKSIQAGSFAPQSRYMLAAMEWGKYQEQGYKGDLKEANAQLDQAIKEDPDYSSPYYLRGILRWRVSQGKEAAQDLEKAVALSRGTCYRIHEAKEIDANWRSPETKKTFAGLEKAQEACAAKHGLTAAVKKLRSSR
jgi:Tfp pilus assembly protein PilF